MSRSSQTSPRSTDAFSRLDVVAALGAAGILVLLLLSAMGTTKQQDKGAVCMNNLHQIWTGMMSYATDNDDTFHNVDRSIPNAGQWTRFPRTNDMLAASDTDAYWGVAYFNYVGRSREVFRCPSARIVDEWRDAGLAYPSEFWLTSTYGVCGYLATPYSGPARTLKTTSFANPETMILAQDSAEQRMEGGGDTIGLFPGYSSILTQWIGGGPPSRGGLSDFYNNYPFEWEWYRHDQRCNTVWLSGNVSKIPFTGLSVGIDYRYYTGDPTVAPVPANW